MIDVDTPLQTTLPGPVVLRRLTSTDAPRFAAHVAEDVERLGEHLPWPALTVTLEGAERWLSAYERREDGRVLVAGAWSAAQLIGGATLFHHDAAQRNVELGCWVVAAGEGRGVALAACRALLAIARVELDAERVEWHSTTMNTRSRRLAERLGFRHEGTLRSNYVLHDVRCDTDVFSLVGRELDLAVAAADTEESRPPV